jgi:hypothetical protein
MPTDPQPEEAATKPLAAAASAAGSYAQIQMYGRGARQRGDGRAEKQQPAEQDRPQTEPTPAGGEGAEPETPSQTPTIAEVDKPVSEAEVPWAERAVGRLTRSLDDPTLEAEILAGAPPGGHANTAAGEGGPAVASDTIVAASAQDAAAAQARMAQSRLLEPPPVAPPAPGLGPAL